MKNNFFTTILLGTLLFLCLGAAAVYKSVVSISSTSTDNAIVRWDSSSGTRVQNSTAATIDDSGNLTINSITFSSGGATLSTWSISSNILSTSLYNDIYNPSTLVVTNLIAYSLTAYSLVVSNSLTVDTFFSDIIISSNIFVPIIAYGIDWFEATNVPSMAAVYNEMEASRLRVDGTLSVSNLTSGYDVIVNKQNGTAVFVLSTNTFRYLDELMSASATTGDNGTAGITNNGGVVGITNGEIKHPGLKFCRTTAANNVSGWGWDGSPIAITNTDTFYYIETYIKTPAILSGANAGPDSYAIRFGFTATPTSTNVPSDGSYLVYSTNLLGSANWGFLTTSNTLSATIINTGVSVTTSTYYKLGVYVTPTITYGYINGTPVATNTTFIPLYRSLSAVASMHRYSGSTTTDMYVDYMFLKGVVTR